jgi:hypothetical protein
VARLLCNISGTNEYTDIKNFLLSIQFANEVNSSYAPNRLEKWFGYASNLKSVKDSHELQVTDTIPSVFQSLHDRWFIESDSLLCCYGFKPYSNTSIDWHRDHSCFHDKAVMINFGEAVYTEGYNSETILHLKDGDVVELNTKTIHKAEQRSQTRINATFRKVKNEYINSLLF